MPLYIPTDLDLASSTWGANCGPGALAALLGREVWTTRALFPHFPEKAWVNLTQMLAAVAAVPISHRREQLPKPGNPEATGPFPFPLARKALAQIQWTGKWTLPGADPRQAPRHSHWTAVATVPAGTFVYDVNVNWDGPLPGGWLLVEHWEKQIAPMMMAEKKGRTGWYVKDLIHILDA